MDIIRFYFLWFGWKEDPGLRSLMLICLEASPFVHGDILFPWIFIFWGSGTINMLRTKIAVPWRRWQWAEDSHNDDDCCCFATQPVRTDSEGRTRSAHSLTALTIFHLLLHQSAPDTRGWPRLSGCLPLFSFISVHIEESVNLAYLCRSTSTFFLQFGV